MPFGREGSGPASSFGSKRELFRRRITVLLAAHPAVVLLGRFVQLEVPVRGKGPAALAERMHFLGRHRLEAARDCQILAQYIEGFHAANRGRDGQAHGVAQRFLRAHDAVQDRLAVAAQTLHAQRGDAAALELWQYLLLEAPIGPVKTVERHLHRIKRIIVRQHFEMNRRVLVAGEADETDLALLLRLV